MDNSWPKPTDAEVFHFRRLAPAAVPRQYVEYLRSHGAVAVEVESIGSGLVWFWNLAEVLELNAGYGFPEFAPGLFGFGSDGAGQLYVLDLRVSGRVTVGDIPAIPLEVGQFRLLADSFVDFAQLLTQGTISEVPPDR